jgi:hypothetical protein
MIFVYLSMKSPNSMKDFLTRTWSRWVVVASTGQRLFQIDPIKQDVQVFIVDRKRRGTLDVALSGQTEQSSVQTLVEKAQTGSVEEQNLQSFAAFADE